MINFDRIIDNIFIGNCPTNQIDILRLKGIGITAILNLQTAGDFGRLGINWPELEQHYFDSDIAVYRVDIVDFDDSDLEDKLQIATQTLNNIIKNNHRVFVHCTAGKQRAPSVVIGYLAWHREFSLEQASKLVLTARKCDPPLYVLEKAGVLL